MSPSSAVRFLFSLAVFSAFLVLGCGHTDPNCDPEFEECHSAFQRVTVTVTGPGGGTGTVVAEDINVVGINCVLPSSASVPPPNASHPVNCAYTFSDAGGGGSFRLEAAAAPGSVFAGWGGCSQVSGPICILDFSAGPDVVFTVTARFDHAAAETKPINIYNGSSLTVSFLVNGQLLSNVAPSQSPSVQIPSAIGTTVTVSADVAGQHPTTTCTVTSAAWQGLGNPIVILNSPEYYFTCSGF
jgi:hypothetical protein